MNKILNISAALAFIFVISACSTDSNSEYKFEEQTYYRIVDNTNISATPYFARSTVNFTFTPDDKTIQVSTVISLGGSSFTIETSAMPYTMLNANTYKFAGNAKATGHEVTGFSGYYDSATNSVYFEMTVDGKNNVYITSTPLFPYTTTTVVPADNSAQPIILDNAIYGLAFDNTLKDGLFAIMNFQLTSIESPYNEIDYKGITVVPNAEGYAITADLLKPSISGNVEKYTITDLTINITQQGRSIAGSYTCDGKNVTFSGTTFNID
ncbi:MAG: hypothetical protein J5523_00350 [Muribaculaceae bacterium]|nr:hypothetical protein [Muribaculaceae bacterium]